MRKRRERPGSLHVEGTTTHVGIAQGETTSSQVPASQSKSPLCPSPWTVTDFANDFLADVNCPFCLSEKAGQGRSCFSSLSSCSQSYKFSKCQSMLSGSLILKCTGTNAGTRLLYYLIQRHLTRESEKFAPSLDQLLMRRQHPLCRPEHN